MTCSKEDQSPYYCKPPYVGRSVKVVGFETVAIDDWKWPVERREWRSGVVCWGGILRGETVDEVADTY
jgi:hypothetical protein